MYLKHAAIVYVVDIIISYKLTISNYLLSFSKICPKKTYANNIPFNYFFNDFTRVIFEMLNFDNSVSI